MKNLITLLIVCITTLELLFSCGQNNSYKSINVLSLNELFTLADSKSLNNFHDIVSKLGYKFSEEFKENGKNVTQYSLIISDESHRYHNVLSFSDFGDDRPTIQFSAPNILDKNYIDNLKKECAKNGLIKLDENPMVENGTQFTNYESEKYFLRLGEKQIENNWIYNIIIYRKAPKKSNK